MSWNAEADVLGYQVEQQESGSATWTVLGATTGLSMDVYGLSRSTRYQFRVSSVGDGSPYSDSEYGSPSTAAPVDTTSCFPTLSAPTATAGADHTSIKVDYQLPEAGYNYQLQLWWVVGKTYTEQDSHNITVPAGSAFPYSGSHTPSPGCRPARPAAITRRRCGPAARRGIRTAPRRSTVLPLRC